MNNDRLSNRKRRLKQIQRRRRIRRIMAAGSLFLMIIVAFQVVRAVGKSRIAQITLQADNQSIMQDEKVPTLTASASCEEKKEKKVLDKDKGYTVKDLLKELNSGKDYSIECDADGTKEGKFPIKLILSKELSKKLESDWDGKANIVVTKGYLTVKNKIGKWKGNKFQKYDGSYVENDFVISKGKTYYFGSDGKKVSGWQEINGKKYFFTKKGAMESSEWKKDGDHTYYLTENGSAMTGWMKLGDDTYYFDADGIMLTGKQRVGSDKCVFGKDGKLQSKEMKIDPDKPMMALTFDDGPGERTHELLDMLEKYDAHATFFMQGIHVSKYADDVERMKEIGCEIGNHSYDHPQLTGEADGGASQVAKTNELLKQACGQPATVLRPPYGAVNDQVKAAVGMPMILWNIDTLDWKTKDTQSTVDCVLNTADDGDVILMHDIHSSTVDAALQLIPKLIENGYQLVTVSEMAEARDIILENGKVYTDFNK